MATVVDRRTAKPVGKMIDLLPEHRRRPRPPLEESRPDLSADGTLLATHKTSFTDQWNRQPVQVWDVASGKVVREVPTPANTGTNI